MHLYTEADVSLYKKVYVMQIHASLPTESEHTLLNHYQLLLPENDGMKWNTSCYARIEE